MTNPYAAPEVTPELAQEERKRPKMWRSLLLAYGVHHGFALLGTVSGLALRPSEWSYYFGMENPRRLLETLVGIPVIDLYLVSEPLGIGDVVPPTFIALRYLRSALVLTIPLAVVVYSVSRRRAFLWYVALISWLAFMSLVLTQAADFAEL